MGCNSGQRYSGRVYNFSGLIGLAIEGSFRSRPTSRPRGLILFDNHRAGGPPFVFDRWDSTSLSRLGFMGFCGCPARSFISVGTGEDEKEARRCMSPRLPTFVKNKGAKVGQPASLDFIHGLPGTLHLTFEE